MLRAVRRETGRGMGLLDLLVVLALAALLVYLVRLDWRRSPSPAAAPSSTTVPRAS